MSVLGNPDLLRVGRQFRGLQQGEAALAMGVSQAMLSRIENRLAPFAGDLIEKAAEVFDLPAEFFIQTDVVLGAPVSVHPMWRKKASVSARDLDRVVAELNLRTMHLRRLLRAVEIGATYSVPILPPDEFNGDVKRVAALTRAHWQMQGGPVFDLVGHIEAAGVVVATSAMAGTSIDGVTFAAPGLPPLILLNANQPSDRMRFSLAHELGHLVMHRGQPTAEMEQEANDFASHFLLPELDVRPYFEGRKIDLRLLAELKPVWRVSMASLLMCARRLGVVDYNQERYLWQQFAIRKYRLVEPAELSFPAEEPRAIADLLQAHMEQLGYSNGDLRGMLHLSSSDLKSFYSLHESHNGGAGSKLKLVR